MVSAMLSITRYLKSEDYAHELGGLVGQEAKGRPSAACEDDSFLLPEIEEFIGRQLPCEQAPNLS